MLRTLCCLFLTVALSQARAAEPLTLDAVGEHFTALAEATTSAQKFIIQKRAMAAIEGSPMIATFTVTDVKPVTFKGEEQFSVEGTHANPAFAIRFYTADADTALQINAGDTVTMRGIGQGFFTDRNPALAVEQASLEAARAPEAGPAPVE